MSWRPRSSLDGWLAVVLLIATVVATTPDSAGGQDKGDTITGTIKGVVTDTSGRRLPGAYIAIRLVQEAGIPSNLVALPRDSFSDYEGGFAFEGLVPGQYAIDVALLAFGTWRDTVSVGAGSTTSVAIVVTESYFTRHWREHDILRRATWQPELRFVDGVEDAPPCARRNEPTVELRGDTIVVRGCVEFPHGWPSLRAAAHRFGNRIILDIVPIYHPEYGAIVYENRYRATIQVPYAARYLFHVRLNISTRTLDGTVVGSWVIDLARGTVEVDSM